MHSSPETPDTVVVDLTPLLPGGENGGAKVFVIALLQAFAEVAPDMRLVLLTRAESHDELAILDRPNVRRLLVLRPVAESKARRQTVSASATVMRLLPSRLRPLASRAGYALNARLKRSGHRGLLKSLGADLLFCPFTAPYYAEPDVPTVSVVHDLQHRLYPEFFAPEDAAQRDQSFLDACRKATMLVAVSDFSRDAMIREGNLAPHRVRTIHHRFARSLTTAGEAPTEAVERLGLKRRRYLVYPANFWQHKNHEMLMVAFGMACESGLSGDVQLVCTGAPGPRKTWLERSARAMHLDARMLFPEFLPREDLEAVIEGSAGLIFPSLFEGFGIPVVEAMRAGIPIACSETTSLPEVAGDAAAYFDPRIPTAISAAIVALVGDEDLRKRLIASSRERGAAFSDAKRMANEYLALFVEATSRARCAPAA